MVMIQTIGLEIRFYSAWIGIPILLWLLYPLTKQCQKSIYQYKINNNPPKNSTKSDMTSVDAHSVTNDSRLTMSSQSHTTTDHYNNNTHIGLNKAIAPFLLLFFAFSSIIFAVIHLICVIVFGAGLTLDDKLCPSIYLTLFHAYNLSFYFFCLFMIYRIRIAFMEPVSLRLHKNTYIIFLILIHGLVVFKIIFAAQSTFVWSATYNCCVYIIDPTILEIFFYIKYGWDSLLVLLLSFLFIKRLCKLTNQNPHVNEFLKRTIFFGLISSLTSLFISVGKVSGLSTEYFVNMDQVINCFCIVFSYKVDMDWLCCTCHCGDHPKVTKQSGSNSAIYVKPSDDAVLEEIFGSHEDDVTNNIADIS